MKDDRLYLLHILERCERIEDYTAEGRKAFARFPMVQDAVDLELPALKEAIVAILAETEPASEGTSGR